MMLATMWSSVRCEAGARAPGKYCGVVVFDRWGGGTLYSDIAVMYVSEKTKEELRAYAGQSIQIDAKEVCQPKNPGDGRIGKFEYLGPAPETRSWVKLKGLRLRPPDSLQLPAHSMVNPIRKGDGFRMVDT